MKEQAEKYAKSITKNETYQKYLINAFVEGWKQSGNYNISNLANAFNLGIDTANSSKSYNQEFNNFITNLNEKRINS